MPSYYYLTNAGGVGVRANMGPHLGASTFIASGVTLLSETDSVAVGTGKGQVVSVLGTMVSPAATARTLVLSGEDALVSVGAEGAILALNATNLAAVALSGRFARIDNQGVISGGMGVSITNSNGAGQSSETQIFNAGLLRGTGFGGAVPSAAIFAQTGTGLGEQVITVVNSGTLLGGVDRDGTGLQYAIVAQGDGAIWNITNSGQITGEVWTGAGNDTLINSGQITGRVNLGDGADTYRILGTGITTETVLGGEGSDRMYGGEFDDEFKGGLNSDRLVGNGGDDILLGGEGNDTVIGGRGDDYLDGDLGSDELSGGAGDDVLLGGDRSDILNGGKDDDILDGGGSADILNGGRGDDVLTGGAGADVFVFGRNVGQDEITDFQRNTDQIDITAYGVTDFATLQASAALFAGAGGVVLDFGLLGGTGRVVMLGVSLSDFDANEFLF